jgi:hypothetical protein
MGPIPVDLWSQRQVVGVEAPVERRPQSDAGVRWHVIDSADYATFLATRDVLTVARPGPPDTARLRQVLWVFRFTGFGLLGGPGKRPPP